MIGSLETNSSAMMNINVEKIESVRDVITSGSDI